MAKGWCVLIQRTKPREFDEIFINLIDAFERRSVPVSNASHRPNLQRTH